jgi:formamidopyrimidine-DNA glycosylase
VPELPEVETTRRGIRAALQGARVLEARVRERRLRWPVEAGFERAVAGQRVVQVGRRAKYLLVELERGGLVIHLGMSGSLRVLAADAPLLAHDHWELQLDTGRVLRFNDPRRFGSLHYTAGPPDAHPLLAQLGPEPLDAAFGAASLHALARRRRVAVKAFLMDQRVVVGVGNIYASEALFRAGIDPRRAAGRVSLARYARLVDAVRAVLSEAIQVGGTTLRDYVNAEGTPGYFRQQLYVYERAGQDCRSCGTPIRQLVLGQRSSYYCPRCQR